ncbi:hypothetical protein SI65_02152 [Aspergillus cristatus]|uniref:Uncharacterized protein n=1 Tax=Aspergillus cristatus TaxID=573508 RepID=A0A1E3BK47_ASPCR|nr:hypothetical protein SI65_02152 [Aspergillus cristatus]
MKVSAVLSTLMVAGLVSAAPPAPRPTDLQHHGLQGPADVALPHDKRGDVPPQFPPPTKDDHDHHKRGDVPPPKDPKDLPPKDDHDHHKRGDVPPPKGLKHAPKPKPAHN